MHDRYPTVWIIGQQLGKQWRFKERSEQMTAHKNLFDWLTVNSPAK